MMVVERKQRKKISLFVIPDPQKAIKRKMKDK